MSDSESTVPETAVASTPTPPRHSRLRGLFSGILSPILAILTAFLVSAIILLLAGFNPVNAFTTLIRGSFGDLRVISEVLLQATPLILIGVGLAVAFRSNIWNIGAEGQFYTGAEFISSQW